MKIANRPARAPHTTAAERTQLLTAFERSGLSAAAFARQHALNYTTFCGWRQRQGKADPLPAFVEVELPTAPEAPELVDHPGSLELVAARSPPRGALAPQVQEAKELPEDGEPIVV